MRLEAMTRGGAEEEERVKTSKKKTERQKQWAYLVA
jgi:hypothetical protein